MAKAWTLAVVTLVLAPACGDASHPGDIRQWQAPLEAVPEGEGLTGFGWDRAVTAENFEPAATTKLGGASDALAGHTLQEIVGNANVRVRGDDQPCVGCHAWSPTVTRETFCNLVPSFIAQPTAKGDGTDPPNAKPQLVKDLFAQWRANGCP